MNEKTESKIMQSIISATIKTFVDEKLPLKRCLQVLTAIKSFICMRKISGEECSWEEVLKIINDTNSDDSLIQGIKEEKERIYG